MATSGTCPHCKKAGKILKKCTKCGTITCGGNAPCGNGLCPVCRGTIKGF
jgi:hypothetical protein